MHAERSAGVLVALAWLLASGLAAAPARALPITLYANVDFGADHVAARERLGASAALASAPLAAAPLAVALDVAAAPKPLASAPLEISFRRWDEGGLASPDAELALAAPRR
jgi:hypothetical protein